MTQKFKAILFDFDGVILDTLEAKGRAFAKLYTSKNDDIIFKNIMNLHLCNGGMNRIEKIKKIHMLINNQEISESELNFKLDELKKYMRDSLFECLPIDNYVVPAIKELSQNTALWIISAAPTDEITDLSRNLKINSYFQEILGSCKKTEVIKNILQANSLSASDVLFIGDAEEDYKAAKANELCFILKRNLNNVTDFSKNYKGLSINQFNELDKYL